MEAEAVDWLRRAAEKREAGVLHDKRHHEKSRAAFDLERERANAWISGLRLDHANALLALIETQAATIEALRAELAGRDAEIAAWLRDEAKRFSPAWQAETRSGALNTAATAIASGQYRQGEEK